MEDKEIIGPSMSKKVLIKKATEKGLKKHIAQKRSKKKLLKYLGYKNSNIEERFSDDEWLEITPNNFNNFKELFEIPDSYYGTDNYRKIKYYIDSNYITEDVKYYAEILRQAILSYLASLIQKDGNRLFVIYDAKDIVLHGWENATLSSENSICDFFLMYATKDTEAYSLPKREYMKDD